MLLDMHIYMPNQDPLGQEKLAFNARGVKKWAKKLPLIDLDRAAEEYLDFIKQANRCAYPAKQRLSAIDALQPLAKTLLDHLRKYLVSQSLPLSEKAIRSFTLQQQICSEIAISYKITLQDMTTDASALDRKKMAKCIHHVMEYSLRQYVSSLQMYERPQKNIWPDACQLYRVAEQLDIQSIKTASDISPGIKKSIEGIFKHYCGLGPISSIQLRHGEMEKINSFVKDNCESIKIYTQRNSDDPHLFWINLRPGQRPRICALSNVKDSDDNRFIDYSAFIHNLETSIREAEHVQSYYLTAPGKIRPDLAKRFQRMFEIPPKRQHERIKSDKILQAVIGWNQIQAILSNSLQEDIYHSSPDDTGILESLSLEPAHRTSTISKRRPSHNVIIASTDEEDQNLWDPYSSAILRRISPSPLKTLDNHLRISAYEWKVSNFSEGGCCLHHCGELSCKTHVGDLIALKDATTDSTNKRWSIGVIRWIQGLSAVDHKIGVQLLSNASSIVEIEIEDESYHQTGILLKQNGNPAQYSLLCPPGIMVQKTRATLHSHANNTDVLLGDVLEKTTAFIHVELDELQLKRASSY